MSNTKFLIIYLIFMTLTYLWRFAFIGAAIDDGANVEEMEAFVEDMGGAMNFLMFFSYAVMSYVAYSRGKEIGKSYLVSFPIVGAVFDLILIFVPFVPTIMNIVTIILGMPNDKRSNEGQ